MPSSAIISEYGIQPEMQKVFKDLIMAFDKALSSRS
jgi:hypothetical protein